MLQNNKNISQLLSQSLSHPSTNLSKLREKRLLEDPPIIKDNATYRDYVTWLDKMLSHLQRHPDFKSQFLMAPVPVCLKAESQQRLIEVYEFTKDKIVTATSTHMKLSKLISPFNLYSQVHIIWRKIMDYFLPDTETAKQEREDNFNNMVQLENEINSVLLSGFNLKWKY